MRRHLRGLAEPKERRPPRQSLEQETAQPVHISTGVDRFATQLLGRDVAERPHPITAPRPARRTARQRRSQPEIAQIGMIGAVNRGDQHVMRLDVPMHQTPGVDRIQRRRDLRNDMGDTPRSQPAIARRQEVQIHPLDEAHRQKQLTVPLPRFIDRNHMRMVDPCRQSTLPLKAPHRALASELRRDHLDRDLPPQPRVGRLEHLAHPAPAQQYPEPIRPQHVQRSRHPANRNPRAGRATRPTCCRASHSSQPIPGRR
jgi:hypothetical protein